VQAFLFFYLFIFIFFIFLVPNEAQRLRTPENEVVKYYLKLTEEEKRQNREEYVQRKSIQGNFFAVSLYCIIQMQNLALPLCEEG